MLDADNQEVALAERRRKGRQDGIHPSLVGLLRSDEPADLEESDLNLDEADHKPELYALRARGMLLPVLLASLAFWIVLVEVLIKVF